MSLETNVLLLASAILVLALRLFFLVRKLWNYPLAHGPGFFFGVAVAPGFHQGPGIQWLRRYRTLLLIQHLILIGAFLVLVALGHWNYLPVMAPVDVVTFFVMIGGFVLWTRHRLGAEPPTLSSVAVPLEARRLTDYISWPREAMLVAAIAFSCILLFTRGDAQFRWQVPVLFAYSIMGLLPGMILVARTSYPLPPERPEEHYRWHEASRRFSLRLMESMRWFLVTVLVGYAVRHGLPGAQTVAWLQWALPVIVLTVFLCLTGVLIRGGVALATMGRDLRPGGSWNGPFRPARLVQRGGIVWGVVYGSGLVALLLFLRP